MNFKINNLLKSGLLAVCAVSVFASCNKDVESAVPVSPAQPVTSRTVVDTVNGDATLSILRAAVTRASGNRRGAS